MKKLIAMILALTLLLSLVACASSDQPAQTVQDTTPSDTQTTTEPATDSQESGQPETATEVDFSAYTRKIEPLAEPATLNVATGICILHDLPSYIAYKTGLLEQFGINAELIYFANGPLMVEAMAAGSIDCGGYGLGGVLSGCVQGVTDVLWIRTDEGAMQQYYAPNDSAIVAAGVNPETGFYGTADDWKAMNVIVAPGTALEYTFGAAMERLGLSVDEMNVTYMSQENSLTSLYAGQGDAWCLSNLYGYLADIVDGYTEILNGTQVGAEVYCASVASKTALAEAAKKQAIFTWLECVSAVTEWMNASEENKAIAVQYLTDWCNEQGSDTGGADMNAYLSAVAFFEVEDEVELFSKNADDLLNVEQSIMGNFDFYVKQGNYQEGDRDLILDGDFNPEFVMYMQEKYAE